MTDRSESESGNESTTPRRDWASEAEEALEGVGNALKEAWEASRESRLGALEMAKKAALQLGDAIDQGVVATRQRWEEAQPEPTAESPAHEEPRVPPHARAPKMGPDDGRADDD